MRGFGLLPETNINIYLLTFSESIPNIWKLKNMYKRFYYYFNSEYIEKLSLREKQPKN